MYRNGAKHQNGAPSALFKLVQLLIKIGDGVNALASLRQPFMQQRVSQQVHQAHGGGVAVKGGNAVQRRAKRPARQRQNPLRLRLAQQQHRYRLQLQLLQQRLDNARTTTEGDDNHQIVSGDIHQFFRQRLAWLRQNMHLRTRL